MRSRQLIVGSRFTGHHAPHHHTHRHTQTITITLFLIPVDQNPCWDNNCMYHLIKVTWLQNKSSFQWNEPVESWCLSTASWLGNVFWFLLVENRYLRVTHQHQQQTWPICKQISPTIIMISFSKPWWDTKSNPQNPQAVSRYTKSNIQYLPTPRHLMTWPLVLRAMTLWMRMIPYCESL